MKRASQPSSQTPITEPPWQTQLKHTIKGQQNSQNTHRSNTQNTPHKHSIIHAYPASPLFTLLSALSIGNGRRFDFRSSKQQRTRSRFGFFAFWASFWGLSWRKRRPKRGEWEKREIRSWSSSDRRIERCEVQIDVSGQSSDLSIAVFDDPAGLEPDVAARIAGHATGFEG